MTTKETDTSPTGAVEIGNLERLNENLAKVEELSTRLMSAISQKKTVPASLQGPSQDLYMKAAAAYMAEMMANPSKILEHQISYWGKALKHYVEAQQVLASGRLEAPEDTTRDDRRFSNPLWQSHPYFNFLKQQYMLNSEAIEEAIKGLEGLDAQERKRVEYFTRQIVDMFSPSNFLGTNPEALQKAVETDGASLVSGLENLVSDIEANDGDLLVTLADKDAFRVGENLATAPGKVVYRNRLIELIQYSPTTETVHKTPLIIFPPWINKFYILDLKPQNSLIRWIVDQGYTLFVVSWRNPDPSMRDVGMEEYIEEGYLTAIEEARQICDVPKVNAIGYCIAGTTLALTLALMQKRGDTRINSATFFTTLTDFSDQGEIGVFLDDDFIDGIEAEVEQSGILSSFFMSRTFSFLRSNDLIYAPAIRSYMMGEKPPAFDLLYWNGDSTNLPAKMAVQYLRGLCQGDRFAQGGIEFFGETLKLSDVKVPVCAVACETDHIAAWPASYNGVRQMGSRSKTFILSESGHIAGIVNPPSKKKYGHYTNPDLKLSVEEWREGAEHNEGSWWPRWEKWLSKKSGAQVKAREPGGANHLILCDAPGTYVISQPKG
ncbi:PHA/PHB synthase family protein [Ovoidimarina sediminis]|uniref:PHA/PHB synthase family protein n=1 Tax=Ovoidimarina sediminis TaxID=3079856 RepID=UPI002908B097|nr:class I poly(R)-hydroxyalkanoic acid synthase [Rhodophyticola sp. MJ-SS7]MDU8943398.1 class I poly(R)-hydroxyalkanoic acid synthase [Rhodophyticola sp. MJ-SS7]